MRVSFKDQSGVALSAPGKGQGYWNIPPLAGDEVLLGAAVDDEHPGAEQVDRAPVNPPLRTYRIASRKWLTPGHVFCRVTLADSEDAGADKRKAA